MSLNEYSFVKRIRKVYTKEQGCTCPASVELADGRKAILKYPKNPYGEIVLVNEYLSYNIAREIGLTIPDFGIALIAEDATLEPQVADSYGIDLFEGVSFFCEYIPATIKASLGVLKHVENLDESCKLILFDQIIKNCDRYASNVIITTTAATKMYAIDHSHAFGNPEWDNGTLVFGDELSPYIWQENNDFYDMLIRAGGSVQESDLNKTCRIIEKNITEEFLKDVIQSIPVEWSEKVGHNNLQYVKRYILNKVKNIDKICETIMKERGI